MSASTAPVLPAPKVEPALLAGLQALSPRVREVLVAHCFAGMSYAAIARLYGMSVEAVDGTIAAAIVTLCRSRRLQSGAGPA